MILKLIPKKSLLLYLGDFMLILFSFLLAKYLRFGIVDHIYFENAMGAFFISCAYVFVYYLADLYDINESFKIPDILPAFSQPTASLPESYFRCSFSPLPGTQARGTAALHPACAAPYLSVATLVQMLLQATASKQKKGRHHRQRLGDDTLNTIVTEESDYIVESQINIEPATCNCCGEFISKLNCMKVNRLVAEKKSTSSSLPWKGSDVYTY